MPRISPLPHGPVWDKKAQANIPRLMKFMHKFGLITGDPKEVYPPLTDVIHKVLNDLAVDEWSIIIGGDSHTHVQGVAFGADSGTVALRAGHWRSVDADS